MITNPKLPEHSVDKVDLPAVEKSILEMNATELVQPIAEREALVQRAWALAGRFHGPDDLAEEHDLYLIIAYEA